MRISAILRGVALALTAFVLLPARAQTTASFNLLYSFTATPAGTNSDGAQPQSGLLLVGNTLYGTAEFGGSTGSGEVSFGNGTVAGNGTVFLLPTNGSALTNLFGFTATAFFNGNTNFDGANPVGDVVLSGNTLYGTTVDGGAGGSGAVFAVNMDGSGFTTIYSFTGNTDGSRPEAGLVLSGNTLYGTTSGGGPGGNGSVFAVNTDGSGFTNMHSFSLFIDSNNATNYDGAGPKSDLVLSGGTLFGSTPSGGVNGSGTIFAINTDGSGFTNLHNFAFLSNFVHQATNSDGKSPSGLTLAGNTLYGAAQLGALGGFGGLFAVNTDGTAFTLLHSFTYSDGAYPLAPPILVSNLLYGTAEGGGASGNGTVFSLPTNGSSLTTLYSFSGTGFPVATNADGANPQAGLVASGNILYGAAPHGGNGASGTIFSLTLGTASKPMITTEPVSQSVAVGGNAQLQVVASGTGTLTYQWLANGRNLTNGTHVSGAKASTLVLSAVATTNSGSYTVVVSNALGSATSTVATVTVLLPPSITTQPVSASASLGGAASFSVKATGAPLSYQWYFDNTPLADNPVIGGSLSNVLTIQLVSATNAGSYYVAVSSATVTNSHTVELTLKPETAKPSVAIAPKLNNSRSNAPVLSGTAMDSVRVQSVAYRMTNINNGVITVSTGLAVLSAGTGAGSSTWIIQATPLPGTNILVVQSSNYAGLTSPVEKAAFFCQVPATLAFQVNPPGTGTLTGAASVRGDPAPPANLNLYVGEGYTLTATAIPNWFLTNWLTSAGFSTTNPTLNFIMEPQLSVTAVFATNQFRGMAGRYDGVFLPSGPVPPAFTNSGLIYDLALSTNGTYSCKVYLASATPYSLSGGFNRSGFASNNITRAASAGGNVSVQFNIQWQTFPTPRQITAVLNNGTHWTSTATLCAATTNLVTSSNYTMLLPQNLALPASPPNFGYGIITNIGGLIHLAGALSDGTSFSDSAMFEPINEMDSFPVYASLYNGTGLLLGELSLDAAANVTVPAGNLSWFKPVQRTGLYSQGFNTALAAQGSGWTNSPGTLAIFGQTLVTISGGGLSSTLQYTLQLTSSNTLQRIGGSAGFSSGSINPADGSLTLSFTNTSGKKVTASGALLPNNGTSGGFFPGTTSAGTISLTQFVPND